MERIGENKMTLEKEMYDILREIVYGKLGYKENVWMLRHVPRHETKEVRLYTDIVSVVEEAKQKGVTHVDVVKKMRGLFLTLNRNDWLIVSRYSDLNPNELCDRMRKVIEKIDQPIEKTGMSFQEILTPLNQGKRVRRASWVDSAYIYCDQYNGCTCWYDGTEFVLEREDMNAKDWNVITTPKYTVFTATVHFGQVTCERCGKHAKLLVHCEECRKNLCQDCVEHWYNPHEGACPVCDRCYDKATEIEGNK